MLLARVTVGSCAVGSRVSSSGSEVSESIVEVGAVVRSTGGTCVLELVRIEDGGNDSVGNSPLMVHVGCWIEHSPDSGNRAG